jgi:hypothetical protein
MIREFTNFDERPWRFQEKQTATLQQVFVPDEK